MEKTIWNKEKVVQQVTFVLFFVVCLLFFQMVYPYHFFFKGQNQLFLMSWSYVGTLFAKPAWVACLAGEFLTQFFYYDYAGATILTATLIVLFGLSYWAVRSLQVKWLNKQMTIALALLVVVHEASCHLYFGYVLSSTFALVGGLLVFVMLRRLMQLRWPWALMTVMLGTVAGYWMFGYGVWVFLLLSVIAVWKVTIPVAVVFTCLLPLLRSHYNLTFKDLCQYPGIGSWHVPAFDREMDMHMMHSYEVGDWDDVVRTAEADPLLNGLRNRNVTQVMLSPEDRTSSSVRLFFYNLVQAQRGRLPDVLLNYYPNYLGTFTSMMEQKVPMLIWMNMHEFYYAISDISWAEKAAFISCITVPGNRNVHAIKRLAECSFVTDERKASEKYLGLLSQTLPYREWAMCTSDNDSYQQKAQYIIQRDSILPTDNSYKIIYQLLRSNPENEVALDYMLCSLLLVKELDNFKRDYDLFCTERPRIRRLYQEAMCIWLMSHGATEEEWQWYIKDQEVVDRLQEYIADSGNPRFADTYWHYYDTFNFEPF